MSCSPLDLRDYLLGELNEARRALVEDHARGCASCQEELDRLHIAQAALLSLRDEEIPQRIAFVSDKVFQPSPWRRWLAAFWGSSSKLVFAASVVLLLTAIVWNRPMPIPVPPVDLAQLRSEYESRLRDEVAQAVAASEARQQKRTADLLASAEKRQEFDKQSLMLTVEENFELLRKRLGTTYVAANVGDPE